MDGLSVGGATIPQPLSGVLAAIRNPKGATVTRKESKTSMRLRKNGVLPYQAAVWCAETVGDRVRVTRPCAGWLDKSDIVEGQIVVVSAAGGATCRKDLELDSDVVAELATDSRVFVTEQDETRDGKLRAKVFSPVEGWVSVKCLAPICDRSGNLLAAGKAILEPADVNDKQVHYSHYVEINHEAMYKALWDSGLPRCGNQLEVRDEIRCSHRPPVRPGLPPLQEGLPHGHGRRRRRGAPAGRGRRLAGPPGARGLDAPPHGRRAEAAGGRLALDVRRREERRRPGRHGLDVSSPPPRCNDHKKLRHELAAGVLAGARAPRGPVAERSLQ